MRNFIILFLLLFTVIAGAADVRSNRDPRVDQDLLTTSSPTFVDLILTGANLISANPINIKPSGDTDNYLSYTTVGNIPRITSVGSTSFSLISGIPDVATEFNLLRDTGAIAVTYTWSEFTDTFKIDSITDFTIESSAGDIALNAISGNVTIDATGNVIISDRGDTIWTGITGAAMDTDSPTALLIEQNGVHDNLFLVNASTGQIGMNTEVLYDYVLSVIGDVNVIGDLYVTTITADTYFGASDMDVGENAINFGFPNAEASISIRTIPGGEGDAWVLRLFPVNTVDDTMALESPGQLIVQALGTLELTAGDFCFDYLVDNGEGGFNHLSLITINPENIEFFPDIYDVEEDITLAFLNEQQEQAFLYNYNTSSFSFFGGDITFDTVTQETAFPDGKTLIKGDFEVAPLGTSKFGDVALGGYTEINANGAIIQFNSATASLLSTDITGTLEVSGESLFSDKVKFTQIDGNEAIDSLADGYMDYLATNSHRFNNDIIITGDLTVTDSTSLGDNPAVDTTDILGETKIGDGTNDFQIESDGDVIFVVGAGLQLGEIFYHDGGFNVVLAAQDTDYQITGFNTDGESNGDITPDFTNDHITVGNAGKYSVSYSISARSAQANQYEFHIMYNNGAINSPCSYTHRHTAVANRVGVATNTSIIDLPVLATVELWVRRNDGGAVAKTITIEQVNLNVIQISGT